MGLRCRCSHPPGYMRLLKESVLQIWKARKTTVREEIATAERAAKAVQDNLDRLDQGFLLERSIDIDPYDRHAEKLRTAVTTPAFSYLRPIETGKEGLVDHTGIEPGGGRAPPVSRIVTRWRRRFTAGRRPRRDGRPGQDDVPPSQWPRS